MSDVAQLRPLAAEPDVRTPDRSRLRALLRRNALGITVLLCFLGIWLVGQTIAGYRTYNQERTLGGESAISYPRYLTTAHFGEATFENWESEFLQMGMY